MANDLNKLFGAFTDIIETVGGLLEGEKRSDLFESRDSAYKVVSDVKLGDQLVIGDVATVVTSMEFAAVGRTKLVFQNADSLTLPNDSKVRVA